MVRRKEQSVNRKFKRDFANKSDVKLVAKVRARYTNQLAHWSVQTTDFLNAIRRQKRSKTDQAAYDAAYKLAWERELREQNSHGKTEGRDQEGSA